MVIHDIKQTIIAIIQARMSSKRLPEKVMIPILDKPLLQYTLERIQQVPQIKQMIVVTSNQKEDNTIEEFCKQHAVACYRGDLNNVASRFFDVLEQYPALGFVRVNGDSPFIDPQLIDQGIQHFLTGQFDIVTNVHPRTFPPGQSVEVVKASTFQTWYPDMVEKDEQEHVTHYFYQNRQNFRMCHFKSEMDLSHIRLVVDTPDDLKGISWIIQQMDREHWNYNLADIIQLYYSYEKLSDV